MIQSFLHPLIDSAIRFATEAHKKQFRKTEAGLPYIYHPISVGFILARAGFDEETIAAGILHDTVEDTGTAIETIRQLFGEKVAELVAHVSENKALPWDERKKAYLEGVKNASDSAKAISVSDRIQNLHSIIIGIKEGRDVWSHFKKSKEETIKHHLEYIETISSVWQHPLVEELKQKMKELQKIAS